MEKKCMHALEGHGSVDCHQAGHGANAEGHEARELLPCPAALSLDELLERRVRREAYGGVRAWMRLR